MRRCEAHNVTSRSDGMRSHAVAGFTEMMILAAGPSAYILWWEVLIHDVFKESLIWQLFENRPTYRQGQIDKHARAYWLYIVVSQDFAPFSSVRSWRPKATASRARLGAASRLEASCAFIDVCMLACGMVQPASVRLR